MEYDVEVPNSLVNGERALLELVADLEEPVDERLSLRKEGRVLCQGSLRKELRKGGVLRNLVGEHLRDERERREFGSEIEGGLLERDDVLGGEVGAAEGAARWLGRRGRMRIVRALLHFQLG